MARQAIHEHDDRFVLTKEMGGRLRDIRKRKGLTQQQVAVLMGKQGSGAHLIVGRLERADALSPTLGLVADFLRACGARFRDLEDLLDRYTSRPTVPERAGRAAVAEVVKALPFKVAREVMARDQGELKASAARRELPPSPEQRAARARKSASIAYWRKRVRRRVIDVCQEHHWALGLTSETHLMNHGVKVWSILRRTRSAKPGARRKLLDAAEAWLLSQNLFKPEQVRAVQAAVTDLFRGAETAGSLDSAGAP